MGAPSGVRAGFGDGRTRRTFSGGAFSQCPLGRAARRRHAGRRLRALPCAGRARAALPAVYTDPLAPKLQTDPRNPPRFQKFDRAALAQLAAPDDIHAAGVRLPATTGFDSTNNRKAKSQDKIKATSRCAGDRAGARRRGHCLALPQTGRCHRQHRSPARRAAPPVELGPIRTVPKKRKAHSEPDDPYAPLGIRAGAFDLFPAVELIGGYDTNPGHEPGGQAPRFYTVAPELRAQSNWSRHELKADLRGSYIGYSPDETPTLSRPYFNGKIDGRVDVTHDTRIDLGSRVLVSTDNPGSPNLQAGLAKLPIYVTGGGTVRIGQRFNRFDLSIKGDVDAPSIRIRR